MADFKVNDQSAAVAKMAVHWPLIAALVGGTVTMRAAGKTYLPQWPKEVDDDYRDRLNTAVLFNAFGHTAESLSAKPFSRPITVKDEAEGVRDYFDNIDALGSHIHTFSGELMLASLQYGLHGVLVEAPKVEGVITRQQEIDAGIRPYLTRYGGSSILGWKAKADSKGESYLTQLRLLETVQEDDGPWGQKDVQQVRVLYPGRWEIWREADKPDQTGKREWTRWSYGNTSIQKIPFVFFYGIKQGFGIGKPPLIDLAHLNVEHWQSSSDQQTILHVARVPILFGAGFTASDNFVVGSKSVTTSISPEAKLEFVEHTGQAIGAGRQSLLDLEDRMRQIGAELLVQRPSVTTATQIQSDDETNRSVMQKICEEFENSLAACIKLMGEYEQKDSAPTVQVFKDFKSAQIGAKSSEFLMRATESGQISRQTAFEHAQRSDLLLPDIKWEDEKRRLLEESDLRKKLAEEGKPPKAAD